MRNSGLLSSLPDRVDAEDPAAPEGACVQAVDPRGRYSNSLEDLQALVRHDKPLGG